MVDLKGSCPNLVCENHPRSQATCSIFRAARRSSLSLASSAMQWESLAATTTMPGDGLYYTFLALGLVACLIYQWLYVLFQRFHKQPLQSHSHLVHAFGNDYSSTLFQDVGRVFFPALFRTGAKLCKRKRQGLGVQTFGIPNIWICNKSVIFFKSVLPIGNPLLRELYSFLFSDGEVRRSTMTSSFAGSSRWWNGEIMWNPHGIYGRWSHQFPRWNFSMQWGAKTPQGGAPVC